MTRIPTVAVDAGHGGFDRVPAHVTPGKRTPRLTESLAFNGQTYTKGMEIYERQLNEVVKDFTVKGLKRCGINTYDVAPEASDVSLKTRVSRANAKGCDLYVSFHHNALNGDVFQSKAFGPVVIHHYNCQAKSMTLSKNIYAYLKTDVDYYSNGATKYGVRADKDVSGFSLYVLRNTNMAACLIEFGFMDCIGDLKKIVTTKFQIASAEATVKGICKTLGVKYIEPSSVEQEKPSVDKDEFKPVKLNKRMYTTTRVNFREKATTNSDIIKTLDDNTEIYALEKVSSSWIKIKYLGKIGYMSSKYLTEKRPNGTIISDTDLKPMSGVISILKNCNIREVADWDGKACGEVKKGEAFTVVGRILPKGTGDYMYKIKSGVYVTASSTYVKYKK